jgi:acetate kinase
MLAAVLQGIDGFVFTAGIGENSPQIRAAIANKLAWLGITLDATANAENKLLISRRDSRLPLYVIPSDEELMIARHTWSVLSHQSDKSVKYERVS